MRFDVDTEACMVEGVPRLLDLADRLGVRFTFFFNMGRAVSRRRMLSGLLGRGASSRPSAAKLSPLQKLGVRGYLRTALLNPLVGAAHPEILREAHERGHEVGLHGGSNHACWQAEGTAWDERRLAQEVEYGLAALRQAGVPTTLFSSPGWQGSPALNRVLANKGFRLVADAHGRRRDALVRKDPASGLIEVSTNLLGEPGGVGYLEHLYASGGTMTVAIAALAESEVSVAYDHPVFAGGRGMGLLERLLDVVREQGFSIVTLGRLAEGVIGRGDGGAAGWA